MNAEPQDHRDKKCKSCGRALRPGKLLQCSKCKGYYHHIERCSTLTRNSVQEVLKHDNGWICEQCEKEADSRNYDTTVPQSTEVSERVDRSSPKKTLTILQWNADGLATKIPELNARLQQEEVDIVTIQETKLDPRKKTPRLQGFKPAHRADRRGGIKGGGLITYVKESLVYKLGPASSNQGTEVTSIQVRMSKGSWLSIVNIYVPPHNSTGQYQIELKTDVIPTGNNCLITGDLNGHSPTWDKIQPADQRGEDIEIWATVSELTVLNNGDHTRINKITGGLSTPSVTLAGKNIAEKCEWAVGEQLSISDHLPIMTKVHSKILHQPVMGKKPRWRKANVNWQDYRQQMELEMSDLPEEQNLKKRLTRLTNLIIKTAEKYVGKTKPRRNTRPCLTPAVKDAIRKRNELRKNVNLHREEWLEACGKVQEAINTAKEESWRDLLASTTNEENRIWSVIRSLKGSPETNSPNEAMIHQGRAITSNARKADIFMGHYAKVSKHFFSKEERDVNRQMKKAMRNYNTQSEYGQALTMTELKKLSLE